MAMKRVLLLDMPLHTPEVPSVALGLLKAGLERAGIPSDILYLNLTFMERVCRAQGNVAEGVDTFIAYREMGAHFILLADWLFAADLFGEAAAGACHVDEILACTQEQLHSPWAPPEVDLAAMSTRVIQMREHVGPFLDDCLAQIDWDAYDVAGFTCTYTQGVASLALARRIKERYPDKTILFGGASCEQEMGQALHRLFPFVDVVCSGKADWLLPELVRRLRCREDLGSLPNIAFHRDGRSYSTMRRPPLTGPMDELPYPDYSDYFTQLEQNALGSFVDGWLPFETSRGCWWGERSHCTFCGTNGADIGYVSKSPERALGELAYLSERYRPRRMLAVDSILDMAYFRTLLPALKAAQPSLHLFYETRASLTKEQVRQLREAGVEGIQPGIESLSTPTLRLMRKGTTALQNIQLLKWAREAGVQVSWNLLMGLPGEDPAEYARMAGLVPALVHLQPPVHCCRISLDRFSPYFEEREALGVCNVRPLPAYRCVYPFPEQDLAQLAYFFDFDYADGRDPWPYIQPLVEAVAAWQATANASLTYTRSGEALLIRDARGPAVSWVGLRGAQCAVYDFCDQARALPAIEAHAQRACAASAAASTDPGAEPAEAIEPGGLREGEYSRPALERLLAELVALRLVVQENGHYLSLAIPDHGGISPVAQVDGAKEAGTDGGQGSRGAMPVTEPGRRWMGDDEGAVEG
jgi:ribosomal peptide maturation radical SAM protein 1